MNQAPPANNAKLENGATMTHMYDPSQQPPPPPQPQPQPKNGLGTAALVLGIIGLLLAWIPLVGFFGFILGALALALGAIGVGKTYKGTATNRGVSFVGLGLGVGSIVISTVVFGLFASELDKTASATGPAPLPTVPAAPNEVESTETDRPSDGSKVVRLKFGEAYSWRGGETITVSAPEEFTPDNPYMDAPEGKRLASMDVTVVNHSQDEYNVGAATFTAQHNGRVAQQSYMHGDTLPSVQLPPGGETTFTLVYEVDAQSGELQLSVQPNMFAAETVYFTGTF